MRKPGGPLGAVSLCFISTNAAGMQGTEGFPRGHRTQTGYAGPFFFASWSRVPLYRVMVPANEQQ